MSLKFLYDGNKVKEDDTPNSVRRLSICSGSSMRLT